jgi:peptide/nickel transport system substrate-binding protein
MDVRNTQPVTGIAENVQQTLAQAGIKLEIIPGDGKQTLTKYRARQHDIYLGQWGSDYFDPNSNAETFTYNADNSDEGTNKTLAWRNAWDPQDLTEKTQAALLEKDSDKRAAIYEELQKEVLERGPFVIIFQQTEVAGYSDKLKNYKLGPSFDTNFLHSVSKE